MASLDFAVLPVTFDVADGESLYVVACAGMGDGEADVVQVACAVVKLVQTAAVG